LPDDWEVDNFGDLDETPEGDYDGDGVCNGEEYEGGTDPTVADTQAPVVSGVGTVPSSVREGVDDYITVTALADDSARGGSRIAAAEWFIGTDPGVGGGTPMGGGDGHDRRQVVVRGVLQGFREGGGRGRALVDGAERAGAGGGRGRPGGGEKPQSLACALV